MKFKPHQASRQGRNMNHDICLLHTYGMQVSLYNARCYQYIIPTGFNFSDISTNKFLQHKIKLQPKIIDKQFKLKII